MSDVKIWLVTGASSGFGRAMTEHLLEVGNKVVATLRRPNALADLSARYPKTQLLVVEMDVTDPAQVTAGFAEAHKVFGRIDVVFNNAGMAITGELESEVEAEARKMFDVNFWGAARVSREAVRFFREVNKPVGGRLLQVSSRLGLLGNATQGLYSASKFAIEGLSESLVDELSPAWNIKVTLIEPGPFRTDLFEAQKNYNSAPQHPAYADPNLRSSQVRELGGSPAFWNGDTSKAVKLIEKMTRLEDAPLRFPLHKWVISALRTKAKSMSETADRFESWNDDVYHND